MSMPIQLNTLIITEGKEKRLEDNNFQIQFDGYHLYPLNTPLAVQRAINEEVIGEGSISKLVLTDEKTTIIYKLTSLKSTN
ncbi:DUF2584 domain-containing protein [Caldibacillus lycopersici]|uniref:DUF2584 domain-containing protein n=1 Tax=Perspicuibacillus lycopersici TaxID=1325689 RepID=A0AAE3IU89_9BACI|nr:DUF2584 domain-containing protein [Perspicuibacillus lycopersici]MCU9614282.1 DUF2584 domain-containing protein [Perspicuibacillus lycopersici]